MRSVILIMVALVGGIALGAQPAPVQICSTAVQTGGSISDPQSNPNGSVTFTCSGITATCGGSGTGQCQYCFSWQMLKQYKGSNVWIVVQPPYPVSTPLNVNCGSSTTVKNSSNTSPVLGAGTYEMYAMLYGASCSTFGGAPFNQKTCVFTVG
jgi:hypothetical protein